MENSKPLISVLIANYNNSHFLLNAVESVFCQTYTNWFVVICDDGSTDHPEAMYKELSRDSRIKILKNEDNRGVAYTRKRLIEETDCELMCFLDPDDELTPNALEDHIHVHEEHPNVSIVFSRRYLCDENLKIKDESRILTIHSDKSYFTTKDFKEEHLVSFKKSFYNKTPGMNPIYRLAEDTYLNVIMEEVGEVYCLDKICYKYRRSSNGLTGDYGRHMFWNMLVQYDTCKRRGIDVENQVYDWFENMMDFVAKEKVYQKELEIRQSYAYRIGEFLLSPIKFVKKLLKK